MLQADTPNQTRRTARARIIHHTPELAWVAGGNLIVFIGALVSIKVFTSLLSTAQYGQLALGLTIAGALNMALFGPLGQVTLRFFSQAQEEGRLSVFFFVLGKWHLIAAASSIAFGLLFGIAVGDLAGHEWGMTVLVAIAFGASSGLGLFMSSILTAGRARSLVSAHQALETLLRILVAIVLLVTLGNHGYIVLLGYMTASVVVAISQYFLVLGRSGQMAAWPGVRPDSENIRRASKEYFAYGGAFVFFSLFAFVGAYGDRWILQSVHGAATVGVYAAVYQVASAPLAVLNGILTSFFVPIAFQWAGAMKHAAQSVRSDRIVVIAIIVGMAGLGAAVLATALFGHQILTVLTTPEISAFSGSLWILVVAIGIFNVGQLLVMKGLTRNRPGIYTWAKLLHAISFLAVGFPLTNWSGISGMAIALLVSSSVYLLSIIVTNLRMD